MLTLDQFSQLSPEAQLTYLWENCLYLACREEEESGVMKLYQVGSFFVEIRFRNLNEFEVIQAFQKPALLLPYVDQLDLAALLRTD